jgi:hypothetical protein
MAASVDVNELRALVHDAAGADLELQAVRDEVCARLDAWAASDQPPPDDIVAIGQELRGTADDPEELRAQLSLLERALTPGAP